MRSRREEPVSWREGVQGRRGGEMLAMCAGTVKPREPGSQHALCCTNRYHRRPFVPSANDKGDNQPEIHSETPS